MANLLTSAPITITSTMSQSYQTVVGNATGNKMPLYPKRLYWYDPVNVGDLLTVVDPVNNLSAPSAPTLGSSAAGTLAATTYYVKLTYVTPYGETLPSSESNLAVAVNHVLTVTSPATVNGALLYNVYVSTATGTETKQNASPIAIGTGWTEPTSGLIAGSALPVANTSARVMFQARCESANQSQVFELTGRPWADFQVTTISSGTVYLNE